MTRYGVALQECVRPEHDTLLRALDARSAMPHLLEVWSRWDPDAGEWRLDRRLLAGIRERGVEPVILMETTGLRYEDLLAGRYDTQLRLQAVRAEGCVVRRDQEPMSKGLRAPWFRHPLYVETFVHDSAVMRAEADVRLAYCTTTDVAAMAEFYPGDACQVVGFDAFVRKAGRRPEPERLAPAIDELGRIAPGKDRWVFEWGVLVGLPSRAKRLASLADLEGVGVAIPWDMDVPDSPDDFTFSPAMGKTYAGLVA